jgi:hypothetical protein
VAATRADRSDTLGRFRSVCGPVNARERFEHTLSMVDMTGISRNYLVRIFRETPSGVAANSRVVTSTRAAMWAAVLTMLANPVQAQCQTTVPSGWFLDQDGQTRDFEALYRTGFGVARGPPHHGAAILENATILAIGTAYYWLRADINRADWDRPDLADRFTLKAVRFDNNESLTNHVGHPLAGASYYAFARVSNLSVPQVPWPG